MKAPAVGWMYGMSGLERPDTRREQLRRVNLDRPRRASENWLRDQKLTRGGEVRRLWLRCTGCRRWKKPSRWSLKPEILARLKCKRCGGRWVVERQKKPTLHWDDYHREYPDGGWFRKQWDKKPYTNGGGKP